MAPDFSGRSRDINVWLAVNAECDCCDKHKCGRPYFWKAWKETTPHFTQDPDCKCPCRHNARMLCRMHPDTIEQWVDVPAMMAKGRELIESTDLCKVHHEACLAAQKAAALEREKKLVVLGVARARADPRCARRWIGGGGFGC